MRFHLFFCILIFSGCASSYKPLRPQAKNYQNSENVLDLDFSYRLGVLREEGNKKYAKREDAKAIRLASVKLINHTGRDLIVGKDISFYSGNSEAID